jgi:D-alanyl-D-alanine carboxypeptidase/D-alanyl-D-alanine-endopeptidase (penicillin-binding protein 4)
VEPNGWEEVGANVSLKRLAVAVAAFAVVSAVALGLISGAFGTDLAGHSSLARENAASASPVSSPTGTPTGGADDGSPTSRASPSVSNTTRDSGAIELPRSVLMAAPPGDKPDSAMVAGRIRGVSRSGVGGVYSGSVVDVGTGKTLFAHRAGTAEIPASVNKLLSSGAALAELGPEHRFTTKVVLGGKKQIILVGGGDPYLASKTTATTYPARASVADLAKKTAVVLKQAKLTSVALGYDASLFRGPAWNPTWPTGYANQVTATSALWVDEGRLAGGSPGPRTSDPSGQAAKTFAAALKKQGIKVTEVTKTEAEKTDRTVAAVQSMPLERIVEQVLMSSDNDAAEVLFRQVAVAAGRPGSIKEARKQIKVTLTELKAWHEDTVVHDGSGLSRDNEIGANTLSRLLRLAAQESHPELRGLITGLPVAGVEGSLKYRFSTDDAVAARGMVRGKTGTLRQVYSLAGFVRTTDGTLVVYAFITNGATSEYAAKTWLDEVTASVAGCGCQG